MTIQDHEFKDLSSQHNQMQQQLSHVQHTLNTLIRYVAHVIYTRSHIYISEQQALEQFINMATAAFKQVMRCHVVIIITLYCCYYSLREISTIQQLVYRNYSHYLLHL